MKRKKNYIFEILFWLVIIGTSIGIAITISQWQGFILGFAAANAIMRLFEAESKKSNKDSCSENNHV